MQNAAFFATQKKKMQNVASQTQPQRPLHCKAALIQLPNSSLNIYLYTGYKTAGCCSLGVTASGVNGSHTCPWAVPKCKSLTCRTLKCSKFRKPRRESPGDCLCPELQSGLGKVLKKRQPNLHLGYWTFKRAAEAQHPEQARPFPAALRQTTKFSREKKELMKFLPVKTGFPPCAQKLEGNAAGGETPIHPRDAGTFQAYG